MTPCETADVSHFLYVNLFFGEQYTCMYMHFKYVRTYMYFKYMHVWNHPSFEITRTWFVKKQAVFARTNMIFCTNAHSFGHTIVPSLLVQLHMKTASADSHEKNCPWTLRDFARANWMIMSLKLMLRRISLSMLINVSEFRRSSVIDERSSFFTRDKAEKDRSPEQFVTKRLR